jgi:hypothetical protein
MSMEQDYRTIEKFINEQNPKDKEKIIEVAKIIDEIVRKNIKYAPLAIAYIGAKINCELEKYNKISKKGGLKNYAATH